MLAARSSVSLPTATTSSCTVIGTACPIIPAERRWWTSSAWKAVYYRDGLGDVSKDDCEAARLFKLAADQGNALAQHNLGFMYQNGRGVPQDNAAAIGWYRKAADQVYAPAQVNLGLIYVRHALGVRFRPDRRHRCSPTINKQTIAVYNRATKF